MSWASLLRSAHNEVLAPKRSPSPVFVYGAIPALPNASIPTPSDTPSFVPRGGLGINSKSSIRHWYIGQSALTRSAAGPNHTWLILAFFGKVRLPFYEFLTTLWKHLSLASLPVWEATSLPFRVSIVADPVDAKVGKAEASPIVPLNASSVDIAPSACSFASTDGCS